jgi:hypothetical protein
VVVDAHNEAIDPYTHDSPVIRWLIAFTLRSADATIVTNEELADRVAEMGGRAFVLPDAIPVPPVGSATTRTVVPPVVLVICTYAADEPVEVFVETARRLVRHAEVRLTGRLSLRARDMLRDSPENLKPLGFLSEADYWAELRSADVIVDLSLKPNCLVCGAYEAIAVGKAPVLSNDVSARRLFGEVATFVDNTADSLTDAIVARLAGPRLSDDAVSAFRESYMLAWRAKLARLKAALECGEPHCSANLSRRRE